MPVPGCKETPGARFSLGIHASLSRPGLADLTVRGKISLARGIHCCPEFISLAQPAPVYCEEHVCTYTYQTVQRLYINYSCYQITLRTQTGSSEKFLTRYLSLGRRPGGKRANT
jgi:hypothetical protein